MLVILAGVLISIVAAAVYTSTNLLWVDIAIGAAFTGCFVKRHAFYSGMLVGLILVVIATVILTRIVSSYAPGNEFAKIFNLDYIVRGIISIVFAGVSSHISWWLRARKSLP